MTGPSVPSHGFAVTPRPMFRFGEVGDVKTHDDHRWRTPSSRAWDTELDREGHVSGVLDELAEPVVITLLRADRARHADDDQPARSCRSTPAGRRKYLSLSVVWPCGDTSRGRAQNVRGECPWIARFALLRFAGSRVMCLNVSHPSIAMPLTERRNPLRHACETGPCTLEASIRLKAYKRI